MIESVVETTDIMEQLRGSIVSSLDTGSGGATVTVIVTELLAFQKITPLITVGTIEPTDVVAFTISDITILDAIYQLLDLVGGYVSVDTTRALNWLNDIGEDKGQQIRFRKNLKGIVREVDWGGLYTRLYPKGSGTIKLSDISIGPVAVTASTDASYGYLTLLEQYACYDGWTALGATIPSNMYVYKQISAPVYKLGTNPTGTQWLDKNLIVDNNWTTYGKSNTVEYPDYYTTYLTCDIEAGQYGHCKYKCHWERVAGTHLYMKYIEIDVYDGAAWTTIEYRNFAGPNPVTIEFDFTGQQVTKFRVRGKTSSIVYSGDQTRLWLYECQFLQSSVSDDSSLWHQGATENVVRCAIGDYDGGATYLISYTFADFLKAWDVIATYGDIAGQETNSKIEYADALLVWGRLMLTVGKVPPVSYEVQAIMLSECGANFAFEELQLGSIVNVMDEELEIDVSARVVRINYPDLNNPVQATVEISSKVSDITDTFKTIFNRL